YLHWHGHADCAADCARSGNGTVAGWWLAADFLLTGRVCAAPDGGGTFCAAGDRTNGNNAQTPGLHDDTLASRTRLSPGSGADHVQCLFLQCHFRFYCRQCLSLPGVLPGWAETVSVSFRRQCGGDDPVQPPQRVTAASLRVFPDHDWRPGGAVAGNGGDHAAVPAAETATVGHRCAEHHADWWTGRIDHAERHCQSVASLSARQRHGLGIEWRHTVPGGRRGRGAADRVP